MSDSLERLRLLIGELPDPDLLARVIDHLPDALVISRGDVSGEVVVFNQAAELLFGYHRSEILGNSVDLLVPEEVREAHGVRRAGYLYDPKVRPMGIAEGAPLLARHRDGTTFPVAINLSPLPTSGGLYVQAVIRRVP